MLRECLIGTLIYGICDISDVIFLMSGSIHQNERFISVIILWIQNSSSKNWRSMSLKQRAVKKKMLCMKIYIEMWKDAKYIFKFVHVFYERTFVSKLTNDEDMLKLSFVFLPHQPIQFCKISAWRFFSHVSRNARIFCLKNRSTTTSSFTLL